MGHQTILATSLVQSRSETMTTRFAAHESQSTNMSSSFCKVETYAKPAGSLSSAHTVLSNWR